MARALPLLRSHVLSDRGVQRSGSVNEDAGLALDLAQGGLYAVADGMGGHAAGELASMLALQSLERYYLAGRKSPPERLALAVQKANEAVMGRAVGEYAGMGTTLVALAVHKGIALLAHVGDSRAYLLRDSQLYRLTEDHSWVAEQVRLGHLSEAQAREHHWRSVVSNALGGEEQVRLELYGFPLKAGDRLLLCTDGLTGVVEERDLYKMLRWPLEPAALTKELIDAANALGGPDNITALVVDVPAGAQAMGLPSYTLPLRQADGPLYLEVLLGRQRSDYVTNYLSLGIVYIALILLLLAPQYRIGVLIAAAVVLILVRWLVWRGHLRRLEGALPASMALALDRKTREAKL